MINSKISLAQFAWEFLRRNPKYKENWNKKLSLSIKPLTKKSRLSIPLLKQCYSDLPEDQWGLFTLQNPSIPYSTMTPFWSYIPIATARLSPNTRQAFLPLLKNIGAQVSALLLLNDDLILQILHEDHISQIRIKNGHLFNDTCALTLNIPLDASLKQHLKPIIHIENSFIGVQAKKSAANPHKV